MKELGELGLESWIYCLEDLLGIVENGILGDVAEKRSGKECLKKLKETKTRMSLKTLEAIVHFAGANDTNLKHNWKGYWTTELLVLLWYTTCAKYVCKICAIY